MTIRLRARAALLACLCLCALAIPSGVQAYKRWRDAKERSQLSDYLIRPLAGDEGWAELPRRAELEGEDGEAEGDDPRRRLIASRALWGAPPPALTARNARIAHDEATKWAHLMPRERSPVDFMVAPGAPSPLAVVSGDSWVNLGPTDAAFQWNGSQYSEVDSGRISGILVDPRDAQTVTIATSGGGIWRTHNFGVANPTWQPIAEALGNLAIGAMDMDPQAPDTLHVGLGDFVDTPGGQMVKTTNGGASWSAPVTLSGAYPAGSGGLSVTTQRIRVVKVDPVNPNVVLVGTEVGLFRSTNGGASYTLVDLPNSAAQLAENVWSIVYTGQVGGVSRWALSGVYACAPGALPPEPSLGTIAGAGCAGGNPGDLWVSTNAGATWTSRKAAGTLPATAVGRIRLGAGTPSGATPPATVIYAQLGNMDEAASAGAGYWRSNDSGLTWVPINGSLSNRTSAVFGSRDCGDVNVNNQQAWYNTAVAVDPTNNDRVLVGGMLCGLRTLSGTSGAPVWENVAHWLPSGGGGNVTGGTLDYVHADWHQALVVQIGTTIRAFAGTDGGLFYSDTLFGSAPAAPTTNLWTLANRGIVTHLSYSVASGDPATGNPFLTYTGMQDNGTRFRDSATAPTTFNQVIGGDGFGAAAGRDTGTGNTIYWASVNGRQQFCVPSNTNNFCNQGNAFASRTPSALNGCSPADALSFLVRFAPVPAHPTANTFLTATDRGVFRISGTAGTWAPVSGCMTAPGGAAAYVRNIHASPNFDGLYGAALSGGRFAVTSNCTGATTACTWTVNNPLGFDFNGDGTISTAERMSYTSMIAFPPGPTGQPLGNVFVASSAAPVMQDGTTLVPDAMGHLFRTTDRGVTWTPLHGNGTGFDLPNVGINVIRYDPADTTNNTLYAGTQLGVYRTTDGGLTWHRYGVGLPMVSVTDLFIGRTGGILRAATFGRGLWEIYPSATAEKGVNGNGDWDRDLRLDFIDLAALSSRMGTNPSGGAQPYYDWNLDMVGTVNGIDEGDLTQFLSRFGDRP